MSEITLVKMHPTAIPEADRAAARRVLFGMVDGLGEKGKSQWRRFVNGLMRLEPGEMVEIRTHKERIGWYHRKHMALEQAVFESQEKFEEFESFRTWLKVGSGYVDWHPGPKGGVIPVPRSLSYSKLEQGDMEQVHTEMVKFLRTEHAGRTLWRHLNPLQRIDMVETILAGFNE
ncbi:Protein of unknown function [Polaromonas sp. OV174]|uniref:DUF1367 family protein n=1 Tax=Polaromonas sp. OV174 TaxID=1855300 RepID=UPI0008E5F21E|nr:DUF1367 family protein [Polaromonas sp. OV174]SFB74427.1 Protein of unknown function [Polaromonas sp. OV174]